MQPSWSKLQLKTTLENLQKKKMFVANLRVSEDSGPMPTKTQHGETEKTIVSFEGKNDLIVIDVAYGELAHRPWVRK